jgi:hypothetical protein
MDSEILKIIVVVGLPCSAIAGLMAYVITFNEYSHHFAEKRDAVKQSLEAAGVTFLFFLLLTLGIDLVTTYCL